MAIVAGDCSSVVTAVRCGDYAPIAVTDHVQLAASNFPKAEPAPASTARN